MAEWLNAHDGLLAVLLSLAAVIFMIVLTARQKRADRRAGRRSETQARQLEEISRSMLNRADYTSLSEIQSARLMQTMEERSRDEAIRLNQLSDRLDAFGDSQDQRLHRVTATLDEKLSQNEQRMDRMQDALSQSVTRLQEETDFLLGSASVLIEPPASYEIGDSEDEYDNNFSLITTITHGDNTLVFMGDAEKERIREWLSEGKERTCDLIKIPHHGVYNKAVKDLAGAAKASIAVVTDSDKNPADAKTLAAFEENGAKVFSTRDGTVHIASDGASLTVL